VHALAHAINASLGNSGKTVSYTEPAAEGGSTGATFAALVDDMRAGRVSTLVIVGGNPVFDAPADLAFADAMAKVGLRIHLGLYEDETSGSATGTSTRRTHWRAGAMRGRWTAR
jgi:molybdopterin-containing oxidoreductase family iron-sulfur binding subunit